MADDKTLAAYAKHADRYATRFNTNGDGPHMNAFLSGVPDGGRILDLGCGPGQAAAGMAAKGYDVEAWDASPEMIEIAKSHGLGARVAVFEDLNSENEYDGIYANFSLLHAPKADMPGHLARIARALKPGGRLHIGLKSGTGEQRDGLGRFYAYYQDAELTDLLAEAGLTVCYRAYGKEAGLDGTIAPWIILQATKDD